MREVNINLSSADTINSFLNTISKYEGDLIIKSGKYTVNARSLMGIFVCDLSKPVRLLIHSNEEELLSALERYIAA